MHHVYIIAEAGINHNGSVKLAYELIAQAANAGVDAVKFQTYNAEESVTSYAPKSSYQEFCGSIGESQMQMLKNLQLTDIQFGELLAFSQTQNIEFLSSAFDQQSVELLSQFHVSRLKIPSGEITNSPLLLKSALTGKPVLLSTGMSNLGDIEQALGALAFGYLNNSISPSLKAFQESYASPEGQQALREKVTLLHCTTEYPADFSNINLLAMDTLRQAFHLSVGFSDHSQGIAIPIAAAAKGATVIEKHFTLNRNLPGPDHKASLEPHELKAMVKAIRQVEKAIGSPVKTAIPAETENCLKVRKSLVAAKLIEKGEVFTEKNLAIKRPGTGLSPQYYWQFLGKAASRTYAPDELIKW